MLFGFVVSFERATNYTPQRGHRILGTPTKRWEADSICTPNLPVTPAKSLGPIFRKSLAKSDRLAMARKKMTAENSQLMQRAKHHAVQYHSGTPPRLQHHCKGPIKLLSNSLQVAQKANRRCPICWQHPARETYMKIQKQHTLGNRALQGNPCSHGRSNTRRSRPGDCMLDRGTDSSMTPQIKSSTRKQGGRSRPRRNETLRGHGRVQDKVPCAQAIGRTGRRLVGTKWVDVKKADGRHRSRLVAKEIINGIDQAIRAAKPPLEALTLFMVKFAAREQERRNTKIAPGDKSVFLCSGQTEHKRGGAR